MDFLIILRPKADRKKKQLWTIPFLKSSISARAAECR